MYNLLMVGKAGYWDEEGVKSFEVSRFLEYTPEAISAEFPINSKETIAAITQLPTLFVYEFQTGSPHDDENNIPYARVGKLLEVRRRTRELHFTYEFNQNIDPIRMDGIADLAWNLDIDVKGGENHRTHWAIKDIDLLSVLKEDGLLKEIGQTVMKSDGQLLGSHTQDSGPTQSKPKVFIVHGRDDGVKNEVARWISRIGLEDVILHEQASIGRTLNTKFQEVADEAAFALIIMTPDDIGGLVAGPQAHRARQNVIFELGYFLGKLGPRRVVALVTDQGLEKPSDYEGVVYVSHDKSGAWKLALAREFTALGIKFDASRSFS